MNKSDFLSEINSLRAFFTRNELEVPLAGGGTGLALLDPIAGRIVGSHYALSHYCAGLMLLSRKTGDSELMLRAERCLSYIEQTLAVYCKEPDYHHDFNNFAWALLLLVDRANPGFLPEHLRARLCGLLMKTPDSGHDTVNWLPMRALNNFVRYQLTSADRYQRTARALLVEVAKAQNPDGMYDDLLPLGQSGNIQYHVYTSAVLQLIRHFDLDGGGGNLENALAFTAGMIDPEGDFNYFGRGANQIFGWGPYFFNLEGLDIPQDVQRRSARFLRDNLQHCLDHNGLLLKNAQPDQSNYWWDYHYSTVYSAHLFFWLSLLGEIVPVKSPAKPVPVAANLKLTSTGQFFCAVSRGKSHYLSERGPQICNLWVKGRGPLFKGALGPYFDDFGTRQISKAMVVMNYLGPLSEHSGNLLQRLAPPRVVKVLRKLKLYQKHDADYGIVLNPVFPESLTTVVLGETTLEIEFRLAPAIDPVSINVPILSAACPERLGQFLRAEIDGEPVELFHVGSTYGVYGKVELFRSRPHPNPLSIKLRISADDFAH